MTSMRKPAGTGLTADPASMRETIQDIWLAVTTTDVSLCSSLGIAGDGQPNQQPVVITIREAVQNNIGSCWRSPSKRGNKTKLDQLEIAKWENADQLH